MGRNYGEGRGHRDCVRTNLLVGGSGLSLGAEQPLVFIGELLLLKLQRNVLFGLR